MPEDIQTNNTAEKSGSRVPEAPTFGARTIDSFRSTLVGGGARPNLFEVIPAFPPGMMDDKVKDDLEFRLLIKAASLPSSTIGIIDVPFRGRNLKIAGDRTFDPWTITVINDTNFRIRNAFERWINYMNKLDDNAGIITPSAYQANWTVMQLGRGIRRDVSTKNTNTSGFLPSGGMPVLKAYTMYGCFPTNISAIDLSYESSDTIEEFTVDLQVQWYDILDPDGSGDNPGASGIGLRSINGSPVSNPSNPASNA